MPGINHESIRLKNSILKFEGQMRQRVLEKCEEGFTGWDNPQYFKSMQERLQSKAVDCSSQKDLIDIANLAMFLWNQLEEQR